MTNPVTLKAIRLAFEAAGMLFIDADETAGEGVGLKTGHAGRGALMPNS